MPASIRIPYTAHFDFRAIPSIRVMESFAFGGAVYAGVQNGIWQYDEWYWSERKGAWGGVTPMPSRECVGNLRIAGASRETFGDLLEPLDRVATGTPLLAQGEILYRYNFYEFGVPNGATEHRLYSCATGALVAQTGVGGTLGVVADGSYMLWARVFAGAPFDTGHGMARVKDGEWSALRVVVGDGAWTLASGVCPSPGAALYRKAGASEAVVASGNEASLRVAFDPLARCVSASCVLESALRTSDGAFLVPAGSLLIGGLRASNSGPQSALWVLHTDGTSRVLGLKTEFTDGVCECGKTNHHASDVVQSPEGDVFVLSECALFRFDPDATTVYEALPGFPAQSLTQITLSEGATPEAGHPGGNCLRFPSRYEMVHWSEDLTGRDKGNEYFYNRIVRRVNGRDALGPGTLWHGTNCAEMFLGRFWAIRGERAVATDEGSLATLYLDWLDNGRWHGYTGMMRETSSVFWQRLRALGDKLFVFGFAPMQEVPLDEPAHTDGNAPIDPDTGEPITDLVEPQTGAHALGDVPVCAVADGLTLRDAAFPFFIRRATPSGSSLFVAGRSGSESIGPANRVVEITGSKTHICSFWNETDHAFELGRADFVLLGGDVAKLPAFFQWQPMSDADGGGKWKASEVAPGIGFHLKTEIDATTIRFVAQPEVELPYDASIWGRLCFDIASDGSTDIDNGPTIEPTCTDAQCAIDSMPEGTRFRVIERPVPEDGAALTGFQITDSSDDGRLSTERSLYPSLWVRVDSNAPREDLSSYTQLVNYGRLLLPSFPCREKLDVVVLVTPTNQPLRADELPVVSRRA